VPTNNIEQTELSATTESPVAGVLITTTTTTTTTTE